MNCRVCGRQFDPQGFQVMVPGLEHGFDRVDCAIEAGLLAPPPAQSVEPAPAVVRALPTAVAPVPALVAGPPASARAESVRPHLLAGANLALLAAGTALTIYLWLRVFGADAGPFSSPAANGSEAFGRTTVSATIDLSEPAIGPEPENTIRADTDAARAGPAARSEDGGGDGGGGGGKLVSNRQRNEEPGSRRSGGPAARPAPAPPPPPPPAPPEEPDPPRSPPVPTYPVPSSPRDDRVPGPGLPGGSKPEQPVLPGSGRP